MTFSNVVFYLERLQGKEPITTHVITVPRRNNRLIYTLVESLRLRANFLNVKYEKVKSILKKNVYLSLPRNHF